MTPTPIHDREEYIEQAYFFRVLRERLEAGQATQDVLDRIDQEILSTTRLPLAVQFLAAELKHTGQLSSGFARLPHYFTPFQTLVVRGTEEEGRRFHTQAALLVLQKEAEYRAGPATPVGLFIYEFEVLSRNRLGYDAGLRSMQGDALYTEGWARFIDTVRRSLGVVDFAELIYRFSAMHVLDARRQDPGYEPAHEPLFGEKEGKIARANLDRDPLYLFAALQRQLNYPEVPRPRVHDDLDGKVLALQAKVRDLELRLKIAEGEIKGKLDLTQFYARPPDGPGGEPPAPPGFARGDDW